MNIEFVAPDLRKLDGIHADALVLYLFENDAPLTAVAGLVDWRLCGALSRLLLSGRLTCRPGETLLMPTAGRFPFDRMLVMGLGPRRALHREEVAAEVRRAFEILRLLRTHSAALALPGRPQGETDPSTAIDTLLEAAAEPNEIDELVVVEEPAAQRVMTAYLDVGHRRI